MATSKKIITLFSIAIIAFAAVGCSDSNSPVATSTPVDTAPPAVPANLSVAFDSNSGAATVSWAENTTDADLAGFVVSREYYGSEEILLASPALGNSFQDEAPKMGVSTYRVFAVDLSGNQSAYASSQLVRTSSHQTGELHQ